MKTQLPHLSLSHSRQPTQPPVETLSGLKQSPPATIRAKPLSQSQRPIRRYAPVSWLGKPNKRIIKALIEGIAHLEN